MAETSFNSLPLPAGQDERFAASTGAALLAEFLPENFKIQHTCWHVPVELMFRYTLCPSSSGGCRW